MTPSDNDEKIKQYLLNSHLFLYFNSFLFKKWFYNLFCLFFRRWLTEDGVSELRKLLLPIIN